MEDEKKQEQVYEDGYDWDAAAGDPNSDAGEDDESSFSLKMPANLKPSSEFKLDILESCSLKTRPSSEVKFDMRSTKAEPIR